MTAVSRRTRTGRTAHAGAVPHWLAWSLLALCVGMLMGAFVLEAVAPRPFPQVDEFTSSAFAFAVATAGFMTVGVLVVVRVPGNRLGWLLCGFALLSASSPLSYQYAIAGLPGWEVAAWWNSWTWIPPIALLAEAMLRFPTGSAPRRWRWVGWAATAGQAASVGLGAALLPRRGLFLLTAGDAFPGLAGALSNVALPLVFGSFVAAAISLLVRLRRARGVERQQLKWLVGAVAVTAVGLVAFAIGDLLADGAQPVVGDVLGSVGILGIPAAIWIAISRYRLYEIDRLLSRTLSYAALTVLLAAVYVGVAVVPAVVFAVESDLLVAAATLAAAAVFRPLRRRVQAVVDRRFDRERYDAARTVERFASRLRDATDLAALHRDLAGVVKRTVQPAHVSLWLDLAGRSAPTTRAPSPEASSTLPR